MKKQTPVLILWGVFIVFLEIFTIHFVLQERYVYVWDYAAYFDRYIYLGDLMHSGFKNFVVTVFASLSQDYSLLAAVPLLPFRIIFGPSRVAYIVSVLTLYGIPTILLLYRMLKKVVFREIPDPFLMSFVAICAILLNPFFIQPLYLGYLDIIGMGFICCIYAQYFAADKELGLKEYLLLGLLLAILLMLRRWYGYWIVSFLVVFFTYQMMVAFKKSKPNLDSIAAISLRFFVTIYVLLVIPFLLAPSFVFRALQSNYADLYSAFRSYPMWGFWHTLFINLGLIPSVLIIIGVIVGVYNSKFRIFSILILAQSFLTLIIFIRVQNVSDHHYYQFYPILMYFLAIALHHG